MVGASILYQKHPLNKNLPILFLFLKNYTEEFYAGVKLKSTRGETPSLSKWKAGNSNSARIISPVWKRWERVRGIAPRVLTGSKKQNHHCALFQLLANTVCTCISNRVIGRRCNCRSFLWHERQWQPFCRLPPNYGSLPPASPDWAARMDRMGRGGQNRCSACCR